MRNKILSIQSKLVYGYVGANIAELAIQLHELDVISFPTVFLAAHTGHQPSYGTVTPKSLFEDLITGIENLDVIDSTAAIITGYIGNDEILESSAQFIRKIKTKHPDKIYICDPVMGDVSTGLYIDKKVADKFLSELIPLCDVLTPNHFELEYILGSKVRSVSKILSLVKEHPILKNKTLVATSCRLEDTPDDQIEILVVKDGFATRVPCKTIDIDTTGTGDFFTALLAAKLSKGEEILPAVTAASLTISKALSHTVMLGNEEMNAESLYEAIVRG